MFGVLVVRTADGRPGYLSAYSGMLKGQWTLAGFVPPVFNLRRRAQLLDSGETRLAQYRQSLAALSKSRELQVSRDRLQQQVQAGAQQIAALQQLNRQRRSVRQRARSQLPHGPAAVVDLQHQSSNDRRALRELRRAVAARRQLAEQQLAAAQQPIDDLKRQHRALSRQLQADLFDDYQLRSADGQVRGLSEFFAGQMPPGGTGDCAAAKLLHYANTLNLVPLCLAEFWWEPVGGPRGLRRHGQYYPACRGKCAPLMPFLLQGLSVERAAHEKPSVYASNLPATVYEDDDLIVVNKPAGLLSVPGKRFTDSVETRLSARLPDCHGRLLVHRLDQATSGLLLAAKNRKAHKLLQHQFERREVFKRYVAVLQGRLAASQGEITLPLRVDLEDRPRQMVCFEHGKPATTRYQAVACHNNTTRVHLFPLSGRTHQLRVHAAHPLGLAAPVVGDELYGAGAGRLLLHAEQLRFVHPQSGCEIDLEEPAPF